MFENDGSMVSSILKNIKRVMASEYSRELSVKVFRAQLQQARLGFKQGGLVPYGVRRLLVDKNGEPRFVLGSGERKGLDTDRVQFIPGPPNEIMLVRRIFSMFVAEGQSMSGISLRLKEEGVPSTNGDGWSFDRVRTVLRSELMIGYYVYNRSTRQLGGLQKPNPPDQWVRTQVMEPIVSPQVFAKAQLGLAPYNSRRYTYEKSQMLKNLKRLFREKKKLSLAIINGCPYTACSGCYARHFGGLRGAYAAAGYEVPRERKQRRCSDAELLDGLRRLRAAHGYFATTLIDADSALPMHRVFINRFGSMKAAYLLAGTTESELTPAARRRRLQGGIRHDISRRRNEGNA
ncbi:MAG: hypothetical protein E5Y55_14455 [Mesorhizobium sp.]|uniref:recombinase family protein n=1 Tax=Mesorhizobium sp. TaxID=1871066 RepID=UPI0012090128|nr:recombinase family protein [Mesorhizobium sp.]TIM45050.1 MAG: hypothetical protein E5Y55_14455 [Mesorhizobium sp.]